VKMYAITEPFHFMHCWKMLRNEPKWNDKLLEVRSTLSVVKVVAATGSNVQHDNDNALVERTEGHDSAKRLSIMPGNPHASFTNKMCCNSDSEGGLRNSSPKTSTTMVANSLTVFRAVLSPIHSPSSRKSVDPP
jgi:hypothetical protein